MTVYSMFGTDMFTETAKYVSVYSATAKSAILRDAAAKVVSFFVFIPYLMIRVPIILGNALLRAR